MADLDEPEKTPLEKPGQTNPSPAIDTDPATDKAVEDIVRTESDDELKIQDERSDNVVVMKQGRWERFKNAQRNWWANPRRRWGSIAGIVFVLAALSGVPFTRYEALGLVMHEKVSVEAVDSKTGAPVSGAQVQLDGLKAETNNEGKAVLYPHAGSWQLKVSKKYYAGSTQTVLVTLSATHNTFKAKLTAHGRQVQIKLVNKFSNQPIANASVAAGGANVKTDTNGLATMVLPSDAGTQQANVTLSGYNPTTVSVDVNSQLAKNTFSITPAGKLYFLSDLSGTIDVVKTNLDGSDRQTVLAGTGNESPTTTELAVSPDWKYLALLAQRSGTSPELYLINTTNGDKLTTIDSTDASYSLIGWSNDNLVYRIDKNNVNYWQSDKEVLKSYNAVTNQALILDQTQGSGTGSADYTTQLLGGTDYIVGNQVVYEKGWGSSAADTSQIDGKSAELDSIGADGLGHKVLQTFSLASGASNYAGFGPQLKPVGPHELYIYFDDGSPSGQFYLYNNGAVTTDASLTSNVYLNAPSTTYLFSPSGNQTFWAEQRDGKNTLFTGDSSAGQQKQIASLSDYAPYGWYTDNYLLMSKNHSELYIMPVGGGTPFKVTDYFQSSLAYNGYGGL